MAGEQENEGREEEGARGDGESREIKDGQAGHIGC